MSFYGMVSCHPGKKKRKPIRQYLLLCFNKKSLFVKLFSLFCFYLYIIQLLIFILSFPSIYHFHPKVYKSEITKLLLFTYRKKFFPLSLGLFSFYPRKNEELKRPEQKKNDVINMSNFARNAATFQQITMGLGYDLLHRV